MIVVQSRAMPPPRLFGRHLTVTYFYVDYYTTTTKNYVQPYVEPLSSIAPPFRRRLIIPRNHHPLHHHRPWHHARSALCVLRKVLTLHLVVNCRLPTDDQLTVLNHKHVVVRLQNTNGILSMNAVRKKHKHNSLLEVSVGGIAS